MAIKDIERIEPEEIDITDTSLAEGEAQELDLKEDWQALAAPPPAARYRLKLNVDPKAFEKGVKKGYSAEDPNGWWYKCTVECKIQDPTGKWQDSIVFFNASSPTPKGKKISSMAGMLGMMGDTKLPVKITELALARRFYAVIAKNQPIMIADCDWSTWDSSNTKKGKEFGQVLMAGMVKHPPKKVNGKVVTGEYEHILKNAKGEDCVAKLKIIKWIGKPSAVATTTEVKKEEPKKKEVKKEEPVFEVAGEQNDELNFGDDGEVIIDE